METNTLPSTGGLITPIATTVRDRLDETLLNRLASRNRKQELSFRTKEVYATIIRDFNRFLLKKGLLVNEESVLDYFHSISHLSPSTRNQRKFALLTVVKAQLGRDSVLHQIAIEKVFEGIPTYQIDKTVSDEKCLTEAQVKDLMNAATHKTRLIIQFLFKTAVRVSEMIGIRLTDGVKTGDSVEIRVIGKGRKIRKVIIPTSLFDDIREVYHGQTWLFESRSGRQLNRNNVGTQIKQVGRRIGLPHVHPHVLRHTRATDMIVHKGVGAKATSLYLGHSSTAITLDMYVKDRVNILELFAKDSI